MGSLSARANRTPEQGAGEQPGAEQAGGYTGRRGGQGTFFLSLDIPLGKACQGLCQGAQLAPPLRMHQSMAPFTEDKAQRAFLVQCLPIPQPGPLLANHRLPPRVPPPTQAHPAALGSEILFLAQTFSFLSI